MKFVKALACVMILISFIPLHAQEECMFWFSRSLTDTSIYTQEVVQQSDTLVLYAWVSAVQPWNRIDGFTFPLWFDTLYLEFLEADTAVGLPFLFKGVNCPSGCLIGDTLFTQLLWYGSVCLSGCWLSDGTPHYVGYVKFHVRQTPSSTITVVDTLTYPPSNAAALNDETGTLICTPQWIPFSIGPSAVSENVDIPTTFFLSDIKPNPFSSKTSISFGLPKKSNVNIIIYDVSGRLVKNLISAQKEAGSYTIEWDGRDNFGHKLSSGAYFVRMVTDEFRTTKRLLLLR